MSAEDELYEKGKSELRLSERILAELPGFRGYKEKELRRESDKLLRNHLYRRLMNARSDLKEAFQKLSDYRRYEVLTDMDRLLARFDRIAENINHASYGYAGFFNIVKIEEEDLDRMISFDHQLLEYVNNLVEEASKFKADILDLKFSEAKTHIVRVSKALESLDKKFSERTEAILGVKN